jgi:glycosyltransferase involved in cell wall biosynthesis
VPSIYDCSPRVVLEAMRCGNLAVAREGLGTREIIESDRNGLLFPSDMNSDRVVRLVLDTLNDWDRVTELGQNARETIAMHYDFESMITNTIEAYRHTIEAAQCR